jgi:hypothetical protein
MTDQIFRRFEMNRIKLFLATALAVGVLGVGLISSPASAVTYFPPLTGFQDDDLDFFIDNDGDTLISSGDRLVGVVEWTETQSLAPSGSSATIAPDELTGVFDLTVVSVVGGVITFAPTNTTGSEGLLAGQPAGTAVSIYLDDSPDLNLVAVNCTSQANCIALASDGSLYMNVGFGGDADESWTAFTLPGGDDPDQVAAGAGTTTFGFFNYFLSILTNNTGQTFGLQSCTPFCGAGDGLIELSGSGNILGGAGLTNGAFARSDGDFQVAIVPEPSTLLLFGAGLLGVNFFGRRRNKK